MREHILNVAERLFYEEGIRAVGVDRIISEAGVAKATLYRHFPAKDHLVETYLRVRHERIIGALKSELSCAGAEPRERLLKVFDLLADKAGLSPFRGCAFLIAVAEQESSTAVQAIARGHKQAIRELLGEVARDLPVDAEALATKIALCYEGALATIAISRDPKAALVARECGELLIDAAVAAKMRSL